MDASMLLETVLRLHKEHGLTCFATVHDSYAVHARYAGLLARTLREVFIEQYSINPFVQLHSEVKRQVFASRCKEAIRQGLALEEAGTVDAIELPAIPPEGNLDLEQVRESLYFFA
jgi:DNA-directed RNA polymerase